MNRRMIGLMGIAAAAFAFQASAQATADDIALWNGNWAQYQSLESVALAARGYVAASQDLAIVNDAPL
jgi:uncharacterized membrane protein YgdD (TMEM256/DUF423 family)